MDGRCRPPEARVRGLFIVSFTEPNVAAGFQPADAADNIIGRVNESALAPGGAST